MSFFGLLFMCLQACLIQNVYSQYLAGPGMAAPALRSRSFGAGLAAPLTATGPAGGYGLSAGVAGCGAAYGGNGAGNVAVAGELPVGGSTVVGGQVPIIGGVEFGGAVPATGVVTISGTCSCGCGY